MVIKLVKPVISLNEELSLSLTLPLTSVRAFSPDTERSVLFPLKVNGLFSISRLENPETVLRESLWRKLNSSPSQVSSSKPLIPFIARLSWIRIEPSMVSNEFNPLILWNELSF